MVSRQLPNLFIKPHLECKQVPLFFYRHIAPLDQRGLFATILQILEDRRSPILTKTFHEHAKEISKQINLMGLKRCNNSPLI